MSNILTAGRAIFALSLIASVSLAAACGSSNGNPAPGTGGSAVVGPASSTGSSTHAASGGGSTPTTSTSASGGCFMGTPMTNDQFLNACDTTQTCQTFPTTRLPNLTADGGLPALP